MVAVADVEILDKENRAHVHYMVVYHIVPIHQIPYLFDFREEEKKKVFN